MVIAQSADSSVDVSPVARILDSIEGMLQTAAALAPKIAIALVVLAVFVVLGRLARRILRPRLGELKTPSFGRVFSTLAYAAFVVAGLAIAIPIAFPSVDVATALGGLGLLTVAAGFAFQDILSNLLSGILLIFRQPFTSGDQIEVNGIKGTVEAITIRETQIKTFDGRLVVVPNKDVYTNAIEVQTADDRVRSSLVVGVSYDTDLARARDVALDTLRTIDGVIDDPEPQAYFVEFGASSINLDLRYWTGSRQAEIRRVQDQVVEHVKAAFDEASIDIPFDIVTLDAGASFTDLFAARPAGANSSNGAGNGHVGAATDVS